MRARRVERQLLAFRLLLAVLGGVQFANGAWALLAPRSFYGDFPFGRGWVEALPAYNEHLVRDVGALFLATGFVLLAAAWSLDRRLTAVALISYLLFAVPHAAYHFLNLDAHESADAIANAIVLAATVLVPAVLLGLLVGGARPRPPGAPAAVEGRIAGAPEGTGNLLARLAYRISRRRYGEVVEPLRLYAHHPLVMVGYTAHELAAERSHRVPPRLKHLAELRAGMLVGCEWCCDFGSAISGAYGVDEEDLRALPRYRESDRFSELEQRVLDYASAISRTPGTVDEELFASLREELDEGQLVELTDIIALENYRARFNSAFGLDAQGFGEGAFCVRPEPGAAPGRVVASGN